MMMMMKKKSMMGPTLLFAIAATVSLVDGSTQSTNFRKENIKDPSNLIDLTFKSRILVPYGPDLYSGNPKQSNTDQPYKGYGYGMGAGEEVAYDHKNHYLYIGTDQRYMIVVDYNDPSNPQLTNLSFNMTEGYDGSAIEGIEVCADIGKLLILMGEASKMEVFDLIDQSNPTKPQLQKSYDFDSTKILSSMLPNRDCSKIALGQENPAKDSFEEGGITIIENFNTPQEQMVDVDISRFDDAYVLRKGLHMPLTQNALRYWNSLSNIADEADFTDVIDGYNTGFFLHPKKLAWSGRNDEELLVNLQENNGLIRINVNNNDGNTNADGEITAAALVGYGLKDHSVIPIDINKSDKTCNLQTYRHLFSMKNPDTIATLQYNDKRYVITANEGDDRSFREYDDKVKAGDVFDGSSFLPNIYVPKSIFDPNNTQVGSSALFNAECDNEDCVNDARIVLGSNAIDYESDWTNPIFHRIVLSGGRGWSIYELPEDPENLLKLVFDSGDAVEKDGCKHYPWSHNSVQDEEIAPADNFPNNTLWQIADEELREILTATNDPNEDGCDDRGDGLPGPCSISGNIDVRSPKDGSSIEQIIVGEACGRLVALTAVEKNSIAMLFDITELTTPSLVKVFHLSPESKLKSPGIAYNEGTIGEIDPENSIFLTAEQSPSGKPSAMLVGAHSGTVSYWEFDCADHGAEAPDDNDGQGTSTASSLLMGATPTGSSWGVVVSAVVMSSLAMALL